MKELINQIRKESDKYGCNRWTYHHSGNVAEFVVTPPYHLDRVSYRHAVITIGSVIRSLSKKLEEAGQQYLIQSFPTLDDLRTVAIMRTQDETTDTPFYKKEDLSELSPIEQIRLYAEKFQLSLTQVDYSELPVILKKTADENLPVYFLCSSQNHPFIWINVGYMKNILQSHSSIFQTIQIIDKPLENNLCGGKNKSDHKYVQIFIQSRS